jgi:hypothetical protein
MLADPGLAAAISNCTAAEAVCRVVPLGPLPSGTVSTIFSIVTSAVIDEYLGLMVPSFHEAEDVLDQHHVQIGMES